MSTRSTFVIFLAICFCLLVLVAILVAQSVLTGMHMDILHTPQMIKHISNLA